MKDTKKFSLEELDQHIKEVAGRLGLHFAPEIEDGLFEQLERACFSCSDALFEDKPTLFEDEAEESRQYPSELKKNVSFRKIDIDEEGKINVVGPEVQAHMAKVSRKRPKRQGLRELIESRRSEGSHMDCMMEMSSPSEIPGVRTMPADVEKKLKVLIRQLLDEGVTLMDIHNWLDRNVTLSRLLIQGHYQIFLEDFGHLEIKMSPLPKTIFFFYLKHPEGVAFTELQDHREELIEIYSRISHSDDRTEVEKRIDRLIDPFDNSISEKCSNAKAAFIREIDPSIAKYYSISGEPGRKKFIPIDRGLVEWDL